MSTKSIISFMLVASVMIFGCIDQDEDGYCASDTPVPSMFCKSYPDIDCDDNDASIYPGAPEICDDGYDNQCPGYEGYGIHNEGCSMAEILSGCFEMGDAFNEGSIDELPVHQVCITSNFYMDWHEVTNIEYAACVGAGSCTAPAVSFSYTRNPYYGYPLYDDFPVIYVSWNQANEYCTWAGKRLPTEAEWEYAARGGLSGKRYPWGDTIISAVANYNLNVGDTSEVESYLANGYGLYDMPGNVWEWVHDWYQEDYYSVSPDNDPTGPVIGGLYRVLRGGAWLHYAAGMRVADRDRRIPLDRTHYTGFRCAGD